MATLGDVGADLNRASDPRMVKDPEIADASADMMALRPGR